IQIDSYQSTFQGSVIESTEHGSPESGLTIELRVYGQISIVDLHSRSIDTGSGCNGIYDLQSDEVVTATNAEYAVSISMQPEGNYVLFEFNRTPTSFGVTAKETKIDLRITRSCDAETPDRVVN